MSDVEVLRVIQGLIEHEKASVNGLDLDGRNETGFTALMTATLKGNLAAVELLLRLGANPDIESAYGETALMMAIEQHDYAVFKALSQYADICYVNKHGDNALGHARYRDATIFVGFLENEGAIDTGKPTEMERSDDALTQAEKDNTIDLDSFFPSAISHPLFKKMAILQPPNLCNKYICSTCGGVEFNIRKNMTRELREEIVELIRGHSEEELNAMQSSSQQLQRILDIAGER